MLAPPGYAKIVSTPSRSRHATRISLPDIVGPSSAAFTGFFTSSAKCVAVSVVCPGSDVLAAFLADSFGLLIFLSLADYSERFLVEQGYKTQKTHGIRRGFLVKIPVQIRQEPTAS